MSLLTEARAPAGDDTRRHLLRQVEAELGDLPNWFEQHRANLADGQMLAAYVGIPEQGLEDRYRLGIELFDGAEFPQALEVAVLLSALKPSEPRFHFLSGMCMQKLAQVEPAARCFAQVLLLDPSHAFSAFRLGECLYALGQTTKAIELFELVIDLSREDDDLRPLYIAAELRARALRQGPNA